MFHTSQNSYVNDYLDFLGIKREFPTLDYLKRLMETHIYQVPFDSSNFTFNHPERITLKNKEILANFKNGQGGICYQANGAFSKLLRLLGFNVILTTVTMYRFGEEEFPYANNGHDVHCAILVKINEQTYLVDLIWGNSFRHPLPVGEEIISPGGTFKIETADVSDKKCYQLKRLINGEWLLEYQLIDENKKTSYFRHDIMFLCSNEHHLSKRLLLMKPMQNYNFDFVVGEKQEGKLYYIQTTPCQETIKEEINDADRAKQILAEFKVAEENVSEILACFKSCKQR